MITDRLRIGDGEIVDMYEKFGFIHMKSDDRFSAPIKGFETTSYIEQAGENIDPRTVQDAFDYKISFLIEAPNKDLVNANSKIWYFNSYIFVQSGTEYGSIMTAQQVCLYNDYKRVKIVGYPNPIQEATSFWRDSKGRIYDAVEVEWTIRVTDPRLCNFNMVSGAN